MAKHMTQDDRKVLEARYNAGQSVAGIARAMSFNYSTIYKELKRGDTGKMDANGRAGYDLYIGTKTAIFPLTGFPKAQNESELATLLGISKKEWADIEFDNDCPDDLHHIEGMDLDDTADGEMDCVTGRISIRYCGCELVPMIEPVSGTVGFVDAKQIMPVADEIRKSGYFKYCARKMASGGRYYVIKDGMVVRGAVLPVKLEPLAKSGLRELADMVKKTRDVADVEDLSEQENKNDA